MAFVKLDRALLSSSLWIAGDAETVRLWVYLLLAANEHGTVEETLPAIARAMRAFRSAPSEERGRLRNARCLLQHPDCGRAADQDRARSRSGASWGRLG